MDFALTQSDTETLFVISGYRDCSYVDVIYSLVPELREQPRGQL
jgi:fatty-acyl-CoA synthase